MIIPLPFFLSLQTTMAMITIMRTNTDAAIEATNGTIDCFLLLLHDRTILFDRDRDFHPN